jgi:hypothetical protein
MWWLASTALASAPFLPLESIGYRVDVSGPLARVEVVERFRNTSAGLVDAVYVFPLAPGAAIDGLHIRIGTREIDGTVQAKEQARATYEAARAEGRTAALTEQLQGDVFTQDVANLPPGEAIEVRFSVVQPVERVGDVWQLTLPLLAPPRFVPLGRPTVLAALALESPRDVGVRADVELTVQAGASVRELTAAPLPRDVRADLLGSAARLSLDALPLDADLVVEWRTARDRPTAGLLVGERHALLVAEAGTAGGAPSAAVDWGDCPVSEVTTRSTATTWYLLARRAGPCRGPVLVGGGDAPVVAWPRPAVDERALASSWARERARELGRVPGTEALVRELGLEYGIVTAQTSFVAVDTGGPVHAQPLDGADAWAVSRLTAAPEAPEDGFGRWEEKRKAKEEEEALPERSDEPVVLSEDFLERIPAGRSYQSAVQSAAGVVAGGYDPSPGPGTGEGGYALDGANLSEVLVGSSNLEVVTLASPSTSAPSAAPTLRFAVPRGTDALVGVLAVGGSPPTLPLAGGWMAADLSGPVVRGRLWGAASGRAQRLASDATGLVDTGAAAASLAVAPASDATVTAQGAWDGGRSERAGGYGTMVGQLRADGAAGDWSLAAGATADRVTLGVEASERVGGAAEARWDHRRHRVVGAVEVARWTQRDPTTAVERLASTTTLSETWEPRPVSLGADVVVAQGGATVAAAPTLRASVGGSDARLTLAGGRRVDLERLAPDGPLPSTWEASAALLLGTASHGLTVTGAYARERFPLVAPLALDPWPVAPPVADRAVTLLSAGWHRDWRRRWSGELRVDLRPTLATPALASDPFAPFVPGYLDPARRWSVTGRLGWQLPLDPATPTLELSGRAATAVDPAGPWWTRELGTVAVDLDQAIPVRGSAGHLRLGAAYTRHDFARVPLPLPVLAAAPELLDGVDASPWRLHGELRVDF